MDSETFRLVNGLAGSAGWLDRAMVLLAEYGALVFVLFPGVAGA